MKKSIKAVTGKKLRNAGKDNAEGATLLAANIGALLRKLEEAEGLTKTKGAPLATTEQVALNIGIDLGDKMSRYCVLNAKGTIVLEDALATTMDEFDAYFSRL